MEFILSTVFHPKPGTLTPGCSAAPILASGKRCITPQTCSPTPSCMETDVSSLARRTSFWSWFQPTGGTGPKLRREAWELVTSFLTTTSSSRLKANQRTALIGHSTHPRTAFLRVRIVWPTLRLETAYLSH